MDLNILISMVLLIISYFYIAIFLIFFDKVTNRIAKVLKKSLDKARRDVKFCQIAGLIILILTFVLLFDIVFIEASTDKIEASNMIIILLLFSISILSLILSLILKRSIEIIEIRNQ